MTLAPVGRALSLPADEKIITFSGSFGGVTRTATATLVKPSALAR